MISPNAFFGSFYYEELQALDQRILAMESEINQAFQQNTLCLRIGEVEGIGPVTATAVIAAISNGNTFKNGRQFAAWLGLVPGRTPAVKSSGSRVSPREATVT